MRKVSKLKTAKMKTLIFSKASLQTKREALYISFMCSVHQYELLKTVLSVFPLRQSHCWSPAIASWKTNFRSSIQKSHQLKFPSEIIIIGISRLWQRPNKIMFVLLRTSVIDNKKRSEVKSVEYGLIAKHIPKQMNYQILNQTYWHAERSTRFSY